MTVDALKAMQAYGQAARSSDPGAGPLTGADGFAPGGGAPFGQMVRDAIEDATQTVQAGESAAAGGVTGEAALVDVVTAVSAAETTVQSVVAVRDRVISAYQEIMRMPM